MKKSMNKEEQRVIKGEAAKKMFAEEEASKVAKPINILYYNLLELRYKLLVHPLDKRPNYFLVRHQYSDRDRYTLDLTSIIVTYMSAEKGEDINWKRRLRYKLYYLKYKNDINPRHRPEWIRVTKTSDKDPIYRHRDDLEKENSKIGKSAMRFWLPKKVR
jgi:hypothetical protein